MKILIIILISLAAFALLINKRHTKPLCNNCVYRGECRLEKDIRKNTRQCPAFKEDRGGG